MTKKSPEKILVVRNDKLGDFILSLPAFAVLKRSLPETEIHALVPGYTAPIAQMCADIDHIILDTDTDIDSSGQQKSTLALARELKQQKYAAVVTLFSTSRIGFAVWLAGIAIRIAPATKIAQIFYNHRITQRRSQSSKPEHQYNRELAEALLHDLDSAINREPVSFYISVDEATRKQTRDMFNKKYSLAADNKLVFIHPGSGGSARNLSLAQYAHLLNKLNTSQPFTVVISCAPNEKHIANDLAQQLTVPHIVYISDAGLKAFVEHIALADLFISGSTGPLHIAGALDVATVGFYPRRQSATALRWQTLNTESRRLAFSPPENADTEDMQSIDIDHVAKKISNKFL